MNVAEFIRLTRQGEGEQLEFKQSVSDECAKAMCAFANTSGGYLIIGILDNSEVAGTTDSSIQRLSDFIASVNPPPIVSLGSFHIDKKLVVYAEIKKSDKIHSFRHVVYIRLGRNNRPLNTQEIIEKASEYLEIAFDELPSRIDISEADRGIIGWYLKKREESRNLKPLKTLEENMQALKITASDDRKKMSNGALLFFHQNPQKYIHHAKLRFVWFKDEEMKEYVEDREFEGPLWKIIDDFYDYLLKNTAIVGGRVIGAKREDFPEYPPGAIREAVINALAHRNYIDRTEIQIFRYPSKIVIKNPGSFPEGITPDDPDHKARNPLLARYLFDTGYTERYGAGIRRIKEECEKHPLVSVYFDIKPFRTMVSFVKDKQMQMINEREQKMIAIIKTSKGAGVKELQDAINLSKPSTVKHLNKLISLGLVIRKGKGRATKYFINPENR